MTLVNRNKLVVCAQCLQNNTSGTSYLLYLHRMKHPRDDRDDLQTRFWRRVEKTHTCWLWTGAKTFYGYGVIGHAGVKHRSNRLSWELHVGPIPPGDFVLHHCDVTACVRPEHLFLGSQADNVHDMTEKGRRRAGKRLHFVVRPKGVNAYTATLTYEQVLEIRDRARVGVSPKELASEFHMGHRAIRKVIHGETYADTPGAVQADLRQFCHVRPDQHPHGGSVHTAKLSEQDVVAIRLRYNLRQATIAALAREFRVTEQAIRAIVQRKTWKHVS